MNKIWANRLIAGTQVWDSVPDYRRSGVKTELASRVEDGEINADRYEEITGEKLAMVDQAEQLLLDLGFTQMRVRIHGTLARIEVLPEDFPRLAEPALRREIAEKLKTYGFSYVTADLAGYRTGSMNEMLPASCDRGRSGV